MSTVQNGPQRAKQAVQSYRCDRAESPDPSPRSPTEPSFAVAVAAITGLFAFANLIVHRFCKMMINLFRVRNIFAALAKDGLADDRPLQDLIARLITRDTLVAIAREYAQGRMLLIGTTNLDARQRVIWNMGAIAASPGPAALILFRQIMLASTAIPGVFPPVMIDVEFEGARYQEMHVDGGVLNQAFLLPSALLSEVDEALMHEKRVRHGYVVRNGYLAAKWRADPRRTTAVAGRALSSLLEAQGMNDLYRLETGAREGHDEFRFAVIEDDFQFPHPREFDAEYIRHLFEYGLKRGRRSYAWHDALPEITRAMVKDWLATTDVLLPRIVLPPEPR